VLVRLSVPASEPMTVPVTPIVIRPE